MNAPQEAGDESRLVATAERLLAPLAKADRARKVQVRVLSAVCIVLLVVAAFTAIGYFRQQAAALSSCDNSNKVRSANEQIWVAFIAIALQGNTDPGAQQKGAELIQIVQQNEKAQDCSRLYGNPW